MKHCQHVEPTPEQTTEFIHSVTLELVQTYQDGIGVNHSEGNKPILKPQVLDLCKKRKFKAYICPQNEGTIIVEL